MCFCLLYRIYLTGVGRWMHNRDLADVRTKHIHPHCEYSKESGAPQHFFVDGNFQVIPVPYLKDNLGYILLWVPTGKYCLVDPGDFDAVHDVMKEYGVKGAPEAILTTHKHWDHAGHNQNFVDAYPDVRIISGEDEPVYASNEKINLQQLELLDGNIIVGGVQSHSHTSYHTMFTVHPKGVDEHLIFTGDNIFEGGVGMFLEGSAMNMHESLWNMFF